MAKDIAFNLTFNSNGDRVMGKLTASAENLSNTVAAVQKRMKESLGATINKLASTTFLLENAAKGVEQLATPVMEFDQAMRAANTMASKGAKDFENLKKQVKELSKEVPVARDVLANGLYQTYQTVFPRIIGCRFSRRVQSRVSAVLPTSMRSSRSHQHLSRTMAKGIWIYFSAWIVASRMA